MQRASDLAHAGPDAVLRDPLGELAERGWTWLRGVRLTLERHQELAGLELAEASFPDGVLLGSISRDGSPGASLRALAERLAADGVGVTLRSVLHAGRGRFGQSYLETDTVERRKLDTRIELDREVARLTAEWAVEAAT